MARQHMLINIVWLVGKTHRQPVHVHAGVRYSRQVEQHRG